MNREHDRQRRFEAALGRPSSGSVLAPALADTLRVLASAKPAATALQLGRAGPGVTHWLLDGLDIQSQLIVVTPCKIEREALAMAFDDDIRITLHAQDVADFLGDVHRHRFDLIVLEAGEMDSRVPALARERLASGGMLVLYRTAGSAAVPDEAGPGGGWAQDGFPATPWILEGSLRLVARSADGGRPVRRGGRKRCETMK